MRYPSRHGWRFSVRTLLTVVLLVGSFLGGWLCNDEWNRRRLDPPVDLKSLSVAERLMLIQLAEEEIRQASTLLELNELNRLKAGKVASDHTVKKIREHIDSKDKEIGEIRKSLQKKRLKRRGHEQWEFQFEVDKPGRPTVL